MLDLKEYLIDKLQANITEGISVTKFSEAEKIMKNFFAKKGYYMCPAGYKYKMAATINFATDAVFKPDVIGSIVALIGWKEDNAIEVNTVIFKRISKYKDLMELLDGSKFTADFAVEVKGNSVSNVIKNIYDIISENVNYNQKEIEKLFSEGAFYESVNANTLREIEENLNDIKQILKISYSNNNIVEANQDVDINTLQKEVSRLYMNARNAKNGGKHEKYEALKSEYEEKNAQLKQLKKYIKNNSRGISNDTPIVIKNAKVSNITTAFDDYKQYEKEYEKRVDPKQRLKDMTAYISMILKGTHPLLLLCGAPGIGKSYNVITALRANRTFGIDYQMLSGGKCSPNQLYLNLLLYSKDGDILLIDDADQVVKDIECVNILKAAADSKDERRVTYFTSRPPEVDEELAMSHPEINWQTDGKRYFAPKTFVYNGSIIVITNMRAGMIDTALRNRAFIQDLDFTPEECLSIVEDIMPNIVGRGITNEGKKAAYEYLMQLVQSNSDIEISIRSFMSCAKFLSLGDDENTKRLCRENLQLQFLRGRQRH